VGSVVNGIFKVHANLRVWAILPRGMRNAPVHPLNECEVPDLDHRIIHDPVHDLVLSLGLQIFSYIA
jgi:hypothetical protein